MGVAIAMAVPSGAMALAVPIPAELIDGVNSHSQSLPCHCPQCPSKQQPPCSASAPPVPTMRDPSAHAGTGICAGTSISAGISINTGTSNRHWEGVKDPWPGPAAHPHQDLGAMCQAAASVPWGRVSLIWVRPSCYGSERAGGWHNHGAGGTAVGFAPPWGGESE